MEEFSEPQNEEIQLPASLKPYLQYCHAFDTYPLLAKNIPKPCSCAWVVAKHDMHLPVVVFILHNKAPFICSECFIHSKTGHTTDCLHVKRIREDNPYHVVPHPLNISQEDVSNIIVLIEYFNTKFIAERDAVLWNVYTSVLAQKDERWELIPNFKYTPLGATETKLVEDEESVWHLMIQSLQVREMQRLKIACILKHPVLFDNVSRQLHNMFGNIDKKREMCIQEQKEFELQEQLRKEMAESDSSEKFDA